ncbi:uncharacterized protein LOC130752513 [Actinidia eriantha]|uniref:uncharacterized protein LOC130752513 n=1 Tax=Actinidia eriantha TaxID=165200 RepID=UPI0025900C0F|nr:uncharacterized protein LOC130752513 [Actinidia eriantha]
MGNCVFRGFGGFDQDMSKIKVVTSNGGMMELYAPITADCITKEFPGHALFRSRDGDHQPPLLRNEQLRVGELYYLLPLINTICCSNNMSTTPTKATLDLSQQDPIFKFTSNCTASSSSSMVTPYRMSLDSQVGPGSGGIMNKKRSDAEVFPRYNSTGMGVWKVKLVIRPQKLCEILAQEAPTEALIESVRTVAKCGNRVLLPSASSSAVNSDPCITTDCKAFSHRQA